MFNIILASIIGLDSFILLHVIKPVWKSFHLFYFSLPFPFPSYFYNFDFFILYHTHNILVPFSTFISSSDSFLGL